MNFLSTFSGIESASVAWNPLGWKALAFAEIDQFAAWVLHERFGAGRPLFMPDPGENQIPAKEQKSRLQAINAVKGLPLIAPGIPNFGDVRRFKEWPDLGTVDVVCGGSPCQAFSIAGFRAGLADPRGNLALTFLAIVDRYRPRYVIWENVPGVLSSDQGRAFASILGGLGQLGYGWCYRVLDAQYVRVDGFPYAVPQRRRRVFVVGYLGDWRRAAAVLSEPEGMRRNPPTRRQTRQAAAVDVAPGLIGSGRGVERAGESRGQDPVVAVEVSGTVSSKWAKQSGGPAGDEAYNLVAQPLLAGGHSTIPLDDTLVAHTLRAEGFDASEDGTGRGPPLVPVVAATLTANWHESNGAKAGNNSGVINPIIEAVAIQERAVSESMEVIADGRARIGPDGKGWNDGGAAYTIEARPTPQAVAFTTKDSGGDAAEEVSPTLRAGEFDRSHANGGVMPAVAFQPRVARNGRGAPSEVAHALTAEPGSTGKGDSAQCVILPPAVAFQETQSGFRESDAHPTLDANNGSRRHNGVATSFAVRRLTPRECERLQGFPDDFTAIRYRGKPAADGPRYRSLGNAWAINCPRWIGERIAMVEALFAELDAA